MAQRFYASPSNTFEWPNGAIGHRSHGTNFPFDCLGPYAKVRNCPIEGTALRLTCYATGYADTWFSVPACTRHRGRYIKGFFSFEGGNIRFVPFDSSREALGLPPRSEKT